MPVRMSVPVASVGVSESSSAHDTERISRPANSASRSNGGAALVTVPFGTVNPAGVIVPP